MPDESKYHTTKDGRRVRKGLWYNINKRKNSGTSRPGKGTVTDEAIANSQAKEGAIVADKGAILKRIGVSGFNKPKRTPNHPTKSHVVVAKKGDKTKVIRFGQQGKTGDKTMTKRAKSFKARHMKNILKGVFSAAYWANKVKW